MEYCEFENFYDLYDLVPGLTSLGKALANEDAPAKEGTQKPVTSENPEHGGHNGRPDSIGTLRYNIELGSFDDSAVDTIASDTAGQRRTTLVGFVARHPKGHAKRRKSACNYGKMSSLKRATIKVALAKATDPRPCGAIGWDTAYMEAAAKDIRAAMERIERRIEGIEQLLKSPGIRPVTVKKDLASLKELALPFIENKLGSYRDFYRKHRLHEHPVNTRLEIKQLFHPLKD